MAIWNRTKRYALFVQFEHKDDAKNYISETGATIHTTIDSIDEQSTSEIIFEATRKQLKQLKGRIYDRALIDNICYKCIGDGCYTRIWAKAVPIYTLSDIAKYKPDFGYEVR